MMITDGPGTIKFHEKPTVYVFGESEMSSIGDNG